MPRVLVIAFHFPPIQGSSGYLRTLKFTRYLPEFGFDPVVLTVHPRAYGQTNPQLLKQIPTSVPVHRSFALDAQKHLSWNGKYFGFTSLPDRYATWIPFAILDGLRLIRKHRVDAIFSTYPIPSAHIIGYALAKLTGKPWVADFRDPMWDEYVTASSSALRARRMIEAKTLQACSHAILATAGMEALFHRRYPQVSKSKMSVILNGFDEADFANIVSQPQHNHTPVTLIHAGLLEQVDRDPIPFFHGIRLGMDKGFIREDQLRVHLIGLGNNTIYQTEIEKLSLSNVVFLLPPIAYSEALQHMADADVLLLFQGSSCDAQIPAKLYEYLRIGKPILAMTTLDGETGKMLLKTKAGQVVSPSDPEVIANTLKDFIHKIENGEVIPTVQPEIAARFSRREQTQELSLLLAKQLA